MKKLFLFDAMALIYRSYYAFANSPRLTTKGLNTSAILGFANTLQDVIQKEQPTHLAVCFDTHAPTARHIEFEAYKANRKAMPEELATALPYIHRLLEAWNICTLIKDGYEADDIIGTFAKQAEKQGFTTYMMTPDKDFGQLVSPNIIIYKPSKFNSPAEKCGVKEICEKYDIDRPEQVIDILALMGDAADNFPGIPGIGEKTAVKLLKQFDNVENLLENASQIVNEKLRLKISDPENQKSAILSKKLATIDLNVPLDFNEEELKSKPLFPEKMEKILRELEFEHLSRKLLGTSIKYKAEIVENDEDNSFQQENQNSQSCIPDLFSNFESQEKNISKKSNFTEITDIQAFVNQHLSAKKISISIKRSQNEKVFSKILCIALAFDEKEVFAHYFDEKSSLKDFSQLFENEEITLIGCDIKNEINCLCQENIDVKAKLFDNKLCQYLINSSEKSNLSDLYRRYCEKNLFHNVYLGKEISKIENLSALPKEKLLGTCAEEVLANILIKNAIESSMEFQENKKILEEIEFPLIKVLSSMEIEGVKIDIEKLSEISKSLFNDIREIEEDIYELAGTVFNISSPKQLGEILYDRLKITLKPPKTPNKQYSTAEDVLQKFMEFDIVGKVLDYRSLTKLKSTYVDALPSLIFPETGRIHTTYNQAVANTGRLSSSNPNLQNIPIRSSRGKEIRKAFIAKDENHVLLSADYSQIELRILASESGDKNMQQDFIESHDIHTATAAKIFNIPVEEVTQDMRRKAKSINFGISYGMSAFGLSEQLKISIAEAKFIIESYFQNYPKIKEYMGKSINFAQVNGFVQTLCGRKRFLPDIQNSNKNIRDAAERNAINMPIQGSSADMIKIAMIDIFNDFKKRNLKSKMILQVHDELVFDVIMEEKDIVNQIVIEKMQNALKLNIPIVVNTAFAENWLDAH